MNPLIKSGFHFTDGGVVYMAGSAFLEASVVNLLAKTEDVLLGNSDRCRFDLQLLRVNQRTVNLRDIHDMFAEDSAFT